MSEQEIKCKICNSEKVRFVKSVVDTNHYISGEWKLHRCENCRVCFLSDPPTENDIGAYYPANKYYTHAKPSEDGVILSMIYRSHYGLTKNPLASILLFLFGSRVNMFPKYSTGKTRMLDVGCGNGQLMKRFTTYGFSCEGFDTDENSVAVAKSAGLKAWVGDIYTINKDRKYDVILLNQVLEHVRDPAATLQYIRGSLAEGGEIIISVPYSSCLDFAILKDAWTSFQAPTHMFHFNQHSLRGLAKRAGLSIKKTAHSSALNTIKFTYIRRNLYNLRKAEANKLIRSVKSLLFIASSILSVLPILSLTKSIRVTVYCENSIVSQH